MTTETVLRTFLQDVNRGNLLLSGPTGSGKAQLALQCLQEQNLSYKLITYGELLVPEPEALLYESPRLKLLRRIQAAESKAIRFLLIAHVEDFLEDAGLWLTLQEYLKGDDANSGSSSLSFRVIATVSASSKWLPVLRDFFDYCVQVDAAGWDAATEREIERLVRCEEISPEAARNQLRGTSPDSPDGDAARVLTLDCLYGVPGQLKALLLKSATFQLGRCNVRGVLLSGPPGTGKTRLAAALAGSLGSAVKVFALASSDLIRAEVGQSEEMIRAAFRAARAASPSLIFLDEVEALFPQRDAGHLATALDQIVAEFDALERDEAAGSCQVFVLAATNFPGKLNRRLRQAGRLEIEIKVGLPGPAERKEILEMELMRRDDSSIDWAAFDGDFVDWLVGRTDGCTPAALANIVIEARRRSSDGLLRQVDFFPTVPTEPTVSTEK